MSVDGKIALSSGECEFSDNADWKRVHQLRSRVDCIMVGRGTIEADDSKLTIKSFSDFSIPITKYPTRIVVDSHAKIPLSARVFTEERTKYPTILAVTSQAPKEKLQELMKLGVKTIECGSGPRVDLNHLMGELFIQKIKTLLLEGGGTLNFSMLENHLVDEVTLSIAPVLVGGNSSISLIRGQGFDRISTACHLELLKHEKIGNNLFLRYLVQNSGL